MFKTKSEVDKHVGKIFLKAKSDSEVNEILFLPVIIYKLKFIFFFSRKIKNVLKLHAFILASKNTNMLNNI
jgi:hypothetical protein